MVVKRIGAFIKSNGHINPGETANPFAMMKTHRDGIRDKEHQIDMAKLSAMSDQGAFDKAIESQTKSLTSENEKLVKRLTETTDLKKQQDIQNTMTRNTDRLNDLVGVKQGGIATDATMKDRAGRIGTLEGELNSLSNAQFKDGATGLKNYFTAQDRPESKGMTSAIRIGGAVGAYAGVAGGLRALSGGSMTTNNQGQRDIAGIPFI